MARDDGGGYDQGIRKKRVRQQNARNFARNYREKNKPKDSTTGVYDVALRSGPGAPEFPYGPPNGPKNPSRTVNWRSTPRRPTSPPRSETAPKYAQGPSYGQQRDPMAMLARGLGTSYKGQKQGASGHLVGRGAVRHSPDGNSSWSGPPNEQRQARRQESRGYSSEEKSAAQNLARIAKRVLSRGR